MYYLSLSINLSVDQSLYVWGLSLRTPPPHTGYVHGRSLYLFLSLQSLLACYNSLIFFSPFPLTYSITLSYFTVGCLLALTTTTILMHTFFVISLSGILNIAVFDPLSHSTFYHFSLTRHTKFVILTFIIHSTATTCFLSVTHFYGLGSWSLSFTPYLSLTCISNCQYNYCHTVSFLFPCLLSYLSSYACPRIPTTFSCYAALYLVSPSMLLCLYGIEPSYKFMYLLYSFSMKHNFTFFWTFNSYHILFLYLWFCYQ